MTKTNCRAAFTGSFGRLAKAVAALATLALLASPTVASADDEAERLDKGIVVLDEIMAAPDSAIPEAVLERTVAIAVFPSTIRAGFIFGAQRGHGFIAARQTDTGHWSPPAFLTLTGGSFGLQAGAQEADVILLIQNRRGLDRLLGNQFTLGGDAAAAVGPVGRSLEASTDLQMTAEILSYSRSRGVFAGLTLGGSTLRADRDANERFYGVRLDSRQVVLEGLTGAALPDAAARLRRALDRLAPRRGREGVTPAPLEGLVRVQPVRHLIGEGYPDVEVPFGVVGPWSTSNSGDVPVGRPEVREKGHQPLLGDHLHGHQLQQLSVA